MDTHSFIVHVNTDDIYKDIAQHPETRFDTSSQKIDRPLPMRKNKQMIRLMKDELGGQIMEEFVGLRTKTYNYLKDNDDKYKIAKDTKLCLIKRKFKDDEKCLKASQIKNIINYLEKKRIDADGLKEITKYRKGNIKNTTKI